MRLYFGSIAFLSIPIAIIILLITKNKKIIVILICLIISIGYVSILENKYSKISDMPIKEMVTIISDIQEKEYKKVCTAKIVRNNKKILINIKMSQDIPSIKYGDSLYIEGEFKQPEEARNYKGYNYKQYLKTKKIIGTVELEKVKILKSSNGSFIHNIQKYIRDTINGTLTDEEGNLLLAILLGDKDKLSEDIQESFKTSNLSHMLAVSGAHVSYIILGLTYVLQNSIIGKKNGKIVCIIFLLAFMAITNFTPSVTRACIMAILTLFSSIIYRKSDVYTNMYRKVQKNDQLAAGYTMQQYERAYRQAFISAAKAADPGWEIGKPVSSGTLDGITRESVEANLKKSGSSLAQVSVDTRI